MNDKERSQKIQWFKEFYRLDRFSNTNEPYLPSATDISYDDLLWLVEQAERAERLQQIVDRLTQENISWQKHDVRQEAKIHDLEMKMGKLKQLGDPTLWGVYEIEKYRELIWEEKE